MRDKVLETERLALRKMDISDVDDLMGIFSDTVAMRYYPKTKSREETEQWVRWTLERYRDHGFGQWVAVLKRSGEFAGQCGLTVQELETSLPAASQKRQASRWRKRSGNGTRRCASTQ